VFTEINVEGLKIYKKPGIKDRLIKQKHIVIGKYSKSLNPCNIKASAKICGMRVKYLKNKGFFCFLLLKSRYFLLLNIMVLSLASQFYKDKEFILK